jgi:hypothetical protein
MLGNHNGVVQVCVRSHVLSPKMEEESANDAMFRIWSCSCEFERGYRLFEVEVDYFSSLVCTTVPNNVYCC